MYESVRTNFLRHSSLDDLLHYLSRKLIFEYQNSLAPGDMFEAFHIYVDNDEYVDHGFSTILNKSKPKTIKQKGGV